MTFNQKIQKAWQQTNSLLCVGLDPDQHKVPQHLRLSSSPLFEFSRQIVDQTAQFCCAFKPQFAYFAAAGAEDELAQLITYIKNNYPYHLVILDAKRGDIGATAKMYAQEAFVRYKADAVTVNPYMGGDTLAPFLSDANKGAVVLCRTSNAGSDEFQTVSSNGESLAHKVAKAAVRWNERNNVMLVVGATYPEELKNIRHIVGDMPLLIPGVGAQGGDLAAVLKQGLDKHKTGLLINSSRGIIYAGEGQAFASTAAIAAKALHQQINAIRATL